MTQQEIHTDNAAILNAALRFLSEIRAAAGDLDGKLTQRELVEKIMNMRAALWSISRNANALHQIEKMANAALQ